MTETVIMLIKLGVFLLAVLFSVGVSIRLRDNAREHEQEAEKLEKRMRQAINT